VSDDPREGEKITRNQQANYESKQPQGTQQSIKNKTETNQDSLDNTSNIGETNQQTQEAKVGKEEVPDPQ
jgi:hypothetical protein